MALYVGDTISQGFTTGTAGESFTVNVSRTPSGGAFLSEANIADLGGGDYLLTFVPATAGNYYARITGDTSGEEIVGNWDVDAVTTVAAIAAVSSGAQTTTLRELRRRVAERFDDYVGLVATGSGSTLTFADAYHVNSATEHYNGSDLVFTSGTNEGARRRVTDTNVNGTLSLSAPVLPAATVAGDTADAFNLKGRGFRAEQIDRAINNAIADAWPTAAVHVSATIVADFDATTGEITIPAEIVSVEALEAQDSSGLWYPVPEANHYGGDGWWADKSEGELRLYGNRAAGVQGSALRVFGLGRHPELTTDADVCAINPKFVVAHAAYHLATGAVRNEEHSIRVNIFRDEMERYRVGIITARGPSSSRVRAA